jgi:hypothetical protein
MLNGGEPYGRLIWQLGCGEYSLMYSHRRRRKHWTPYTVNRLLLELGHCLEGASCPVPAFYAKLTTWQWTRVTWGELPPGVRISPHRRAPFLDWNEVNDVVEARRPRKIHTGIKVTGQYVQNLGGRLLK